MAKRTLDYEVPESFYKVDLELLSKYQTYSAELLRLSLLLLAGYGFLLKEFARPDTKFLARLTCHRWLLFVGLVAVGLSAAAAIAHRYFSTDGFANQVSYYRFSRRLAESSETDRAKVEARALGDYATMLRLYWRSKWLLRLSATSLAVAAAATVIAFLVTLGSPV